MSAMEHRATFELAPEAASKARAVVNAELGPAVSTKVLEDATLLVSELVTNAVRHAPREGLPKIELRLKVDPARVRVVVSDPGTGFVAEPKLPTASESSGWRSGSITRVASRGGRLATVSPSDSTARRLIMVREPWPRVFVLDLTPGGEGPPEGHFVGVLQVAADGEAARERRDPDRQVLHLLRDKQRGRLARRVRVGRDNQLCCAFTSDPLQELGYPQVLGLDPVQRRQGPAEDVVEAAVLIGPFYRADVVGVFHDADHGLVPTGVAADLTLLGLGQVEAAPARFDLLLDLLQRLGEPYGVLFLAPDDVEGDALGAPRSDGG